MADHSSRQSAIDETMSAVKRICSDARMNRERLKQIEPVLLQLANRVDLFPEEEFGIPTDERIRLYRLAEDEDGLFALYFHAANVPASVGPHNHTTWACIAGIAGTEMNTFYARGEDGMPIVTGTAAVRKGDVISLMPDDLHSIVADGLEPLRNLHLYGKAIDRLDERVFWNVEANAWKQIPPTSGIIERRQV